MKLLGLVVIVAVLTWYGRQRHNNPFATTHSIVLSGAPGHLQIASNRVNRRAHESTVVSVFCDSGGPRPVAGSPWRLITVDSSGVHPRECYATPPAAWATLDTTAKSSGSDSAGTDARWPDPKESVEATVGDVSAQWTRPFLDTRQALLLNIGPSVRCMYWDAQRAQCDSSEKSALKEKIELIVAANGTAGQIRNLRAVFRPRFLVAVPSCPARNDSALLPVNVICPDSSSFSFTFRIGRGNSVHFDSE